MNRKIVAVWMSLAMVFGLIVIVDITTDFVPTVKGDTLYVNKTGSGGAYTKIQDAINASSDGDTVYVYNGTYYGQLVVNKTINLTGENKETTIINFTGSADVVHITASYVNLTGFTITNDGSPGSDAGIQINSFQNKIYGNNIFKNDRYGIHLISSDRNNITNNNISYNGIAIFCVDSCWNNITGQEICSDVASGIVIYSSSDHNIVARNKLISPDRSSITLSSSRWNNLTENMIDRGGIFVMGTSIQHWNTHFIDTSNHANGRPVLYWKDRTGDIVPLDMGQVILANCVNILVENQNISYCNAAIELGFSTSCNIINNNATNVTDGIYIYKSNNNTVAGNNASHIDYGIYMEYSDKNTIMSNDLMDNGYGIYLDNSKENSLTGNILYENSDAIHVYRSYWNNITNNYASQNIWGTYVRWYSDGNTIEGNTYYDNAQGVQIVNANWNYIISNDVISNFGSGIYIGDDACWNIFANNNITNNENGIRIMDLYAENNKLYHNSFIGNNHHAIDMTIDRNEWDNGYPSGGNYWSTYTGTDHYKGPNQDIPGSDGIGDINYTLDPNSIDHYPLMEPYVYTPLENYTVLKQGWNLISIPLIQDNQDLINVLEMINGWYDAVQWYDSLDSKDFWKHYKVGKPMGNDLFHLNETMGFWIHIINPGDTIFIYNGTQPTVNQTISIHPGWNLVGYPSTTSYNRTGGLNNLTFGTHVDSIWTYIASTQKWKELGPSDYFELGRGYWVHAKVECEWEVPL